MSKFNKGKSKLKDAPLPADDTMARWVPLGRTVRQAGVIVGFVPAAFALKDGEAYLSASWTGAYKGTATEQLKKAVADLCKKHKGVNAAGAFAIGTVSQIEKAGSSAGESIKAVSKGSIDNPGYAALLGYPAANDDLLALLADEAWAEVALAKDLVP